MRPTSRRAAVLFAALAGATTVLVAQQGPPPLVSPQEILDGLPADGSRWLTFGGNYANHRHSPLTQITPANVDRLVPKWTFQTGVIGNFETTSLIRDNVLYVTGPLNVAWAIDARTGRQIWRYRRELPENLTACCGLVNRGFAMLGDKLFMTTLDAHLLALDMRTGAVVWDATLEKYSNGYAATIAPIVAKDKVIVGVAGGEFGIRGFIDAYEASTGKRAWRFYTIPGPGEPGHDTWAGDSWKTGGAPTWITGSYDPDLNLIYWGTGNPGPDWNGEVRKGDNLYADSALAIDADTGKLAWFFQFTPWDVHDWDAIQVPILADLELNGESRKTMMWANRNAFYYTLDRKTGEFLVGKTFAKQTWAEGLDEKGRPIRAPGKLPTPEGNVVSPPILGGTNWYSPAYSPRTELFYVNAYDGEQKYFLREEEYREGEQYTGGGAENVLPVDKYKSAIRALDPRTGDLRWEFEMQPRSSSGVLATAGDLVFGGTADGYFFALDAKTGRELWHVAVGGRVHSAPITYSVNGKQLVTIAAGNAVFTFGLD